MRDVAIVGAGMTNFGKFLDRSMKDIAGEAVKGALDSAGIDKSKLQVAVVGNATAGLITGQEMIRGQVVLREMGIGGIPVINTENACASSSTAFHVAWMYVASGMYDVALAVGMEKLYHEDKRRSFQAIGAARHLHAGVARQHAAQRRHDVVLDDAERFFQRHRRRRIDGESDCASPIDATQLRRRHRGLHGDEFAERQHATQWRGKGHRRQLLRRLPALGAQDDRQALVAIEVLAQPGAVAQCAHYRAHFGTIPADLGQPSIIRSQPQLR